MKRLSLTLEEKGRIGVQFKRLPDCPVCSSPKYASNQEPIRFVESRPKWRAL